MEKYLESITSQGSCGDMRSEYAEPLSASNRSRKNREQIETCQSAKESEDLSCPLLNFGKKFSGSD